MKDARKTKAQLITELKDLRERLARLEASQVDRKDTGARQWQNSALIEAMPQAGRNGSNFKGIIENLAVNEGFEKFAAIDLQKIPGDRDEQIFLKGLAEHIRKSDRKALVGDKISVSSCRSCHDPMSFSHAAKGPVPHNGSSAELDVARWNGIWSKRILEALVQGQAKYRNFLDELGDAAYKTDDKGRITYVNKMAEKLTGLSIEKLIGKPFLPLFDKESQPRALEEYERTLCGESPEFELTFRTGRIAHFKSRPLKDGGGKIVGAFGIARDISKHRQAEEKIKEFEKRLRALLNASTEAILLIDAEGLILWANKTAAQRLSTSIEGCVGRSVYDLLPPENREERKRVVEGVLRSGVAVRFEDERQGAVIDSSVYPVLDDDGRVVQLAIFARDVTRERRAEEGLKKREAALRTRTRELEEMNTALRVLLRKRDHDEREFEENVLSNIKELVAPCIEKLKRCRLSDKQKSYVDILEANLNSVMSGFSRTLSSKYWRLTSSEIRIAQLVRQGKTTKEMAELLNLSPRTIETHRKNIRAKLNIKSNRANLRSHLLTLQ